jgi:hypothetical protein
VSTPADETTEAYLLDYGREFIRGYDYALDTNYPEVVKFIGESGLAGDYFPLYGRQLGVNVAMAMFLAEADFYVFFLDEPGVGMKILKIDSAAGRGDFGSEWTISTPEERRIHRVKEYLGLEGAHLLQVAPFADFFNTPGINPVSFGMKPIGKQGYVDGSGAGNITGFVTESEIPDIKERLQKDASQRELTERYAQLTESGMSPQVRGIEFEKLWRQVLDFHGWRPKKIRIPGEDNDFTAIYQGLHILGEVRWFDEPMTGGKMREFLAKLDPRPQTIGLFVSHSGVDAGGLAVVRRAVNSKTVVIFGQDEIEKIMLEPADPGPIFEEKLRDAYDYIFESIEGS